METNRITNDLITRLNSNEIFVFGSNATGRHGKGAAKTALRFGAKWGQGDGLQGNSYGIPTKGTDLRQSLNTVQIKRYVDNFIQFAKNTPENIYLVTEIGCGLANFKPKEIAPLFADAIEIDNIHLPKSFWRILAK